ncbi:MAG TPA: PEP-CTERM sorting domain-containing protein [Brevundimonas sp.]|jgi:hypothetical protein
MSHVVVTKGEGQVIKTGVSKRWKIAVAVLALLGIGAWSGGLLNPRAIAQALKDPLSLFAARSPGERAPGALTQKKPPLSSGVQIARVVPRERVLSSGRSRPAGPVETEAPGTPGMTIAEPVDGDLAGTPLFSDSGIVAGGGGGGGGGAPFFVPPTSNGPGVGGGGEPPVGGGPLVPPTSPVPEPETWLTMMIGLFMIGSVLRRRKIGAAASLSVPLGTPGDDVTRAIRG